MFTVTFRHLFLALFLVPSALAAAPAYAAPPLPEIVQRDQPGLAVAGETPFRFLGLKVYDLRLWAPDGVYSNSPAQPFALELVYNMNFKGTDIASRSVDEMRAQGRGDEAKLARWGEEMARIFPDIKPGDTLIGVSVPGKEARFYTRERFIAAVPDAEFSAAFFGIWLGEKTTEPAMRKRLLERH